MMTETPVEILELPNQLRNLFTGKVPEYTSGKPEARESNFLSRALSAYAVHKLSGCSLDDAAASIVDGGGDGGIDAIFYAAASDTLFVVQSKYIANGRGEPDLGDVTKFKTGLENLLQGKLELFQQNQAWKIRTSELKIQLDKASRICSVLVYSGINLVSDDRLSLFEDLERRFCSDGEDNYLECQTCNLTTIHNWLIGADIGIGVPRVELTLLKPGWVKNPYETVFGLLPLKDLATLYDEHGKRLVVANIRAYKGRTEVNEQILTTIQDEPHHFFYLNNGLTAYCDRLEVSNTDRANAESKRITAYGLSIVNGAQTLGSVAAFFKQELNSIPDGNVFIKVISLQRCEDDRAFAENYLPLQNKDDMETPNSDENNFTLKEATTASACLAKSQDCDDLCSRIMANRVSLWSMDEIYSSTELYRSRYSRVFRADRSARTVWRAVQTQRLVIQAMQDSGKASSGVRKAFFENARWVLLTVIFVKLRPEQGNALSLTIAESEIISRSTIEFLEMLWTVCEVQGYVSRRSGDNSGVVRFDQARHFKSVFCDASECKRLRSSLLERLSS